MGIRGLIAGASAVAVVAGGAAVAVAMTDPGAGSTAAEPPLPTIAAPASSIVHVGTPFTASTAAALATTSTPVPTVSITASSTGAAPAATPTGAPAPPTATRPPVVAPSRPASVPPPTHLPGGPLPLHYSTGDATRVITVTAPSSGSTTATVQAWNRAPGGWVRYGGAVPAHVGAQGIGAASETRSVTPAGTFTVTQAFGAYGNPGTPLPYVQTTAADWWISQAGPLYNTRQRCSGSCPFTQGSPNEHLYYERPYYDYAAVIDYNTRNAPGGVRPGAGSAFFLHVTDGRPTAGCVAIPAANLIALLRWLSPAAHPRILIGVT